MHHCLRNERSWNEVQPPDSKEWGLGCWVCRHATERKAMDIGGFADFGLQDQMLDLARFLCRQKAARHRQGLQAHMLQWVPAAARMGRACRPMRSPRSWTCCRALPMVSWKSNAWIPGKGHGHGLLLVPGPP